MSNPLHHKKLKDAITQLAATPSDEVTIPVSLANEMLDFMNECEEKGLELKEVRNKLCRIRTSMDELYHIKEQLKEELKEEIHKINCRRVRGDG